MLVDSFYIYTFLYFIDIFLNIDYEFKVFLFEGVSDMECTINLTHTTEAKSIGMK